MNRRAQVLMAIISLLLVNCTNAASVHVSLTDNGVHVSAELRKFSMHAETKAVFLHGELAIDDQARRLKSVNLDCFALTINGVVSDELAIDSIASVLTDPYPANTDGRIKVPVYWVFPAGKSVDHVDLSTATLEIRPGYRSCFHY